MPVVAASMRSNSFQSMPALFGSWHVDGFEKSSPTPDNVPGSVVGMEETVVCV